MSGQYEMKGSPEIEAEAAPKSSCLSSTAKCVLLTLLIIVFIIIIVILAVALLNKTKKYNELEELASSHNSSTTCLTQTCIETANRVNQYMDPSASPCENFYQYACGGWEAMHSIPYYSPYSWSVTEDLARNNHEFFREALEKPVDSSSFGPDIKARNLYASCMDTDRIKQLGLSEPRTIIDGLGGLSFNLTEPFDNFDLTERLIEMRELQTDPLFLLSINFHQYERNTILLDISPPAGTIVITKKMSVNGFTRLAPEVLSVWNDLYKGETPPPLDAFLETYYIMNDVKETVDSSASSTPKNWNDTLATVEELQLLCPQINWTRVIGATLSKIDQPIPDIISVPNKVYILALSLLLKTWNTRSLDNYLKFNFVMENLIYFDYKYRKVQDDLLNKLLLSRNFWRPQPRWLFCVNEMMTNLELILGRWYVEDYLEKENAVVKDVDEMIEQIRTTYIEVLQRTSLLDGETRSFAINKIKAMDKQVAFAAEYTNKQIIEEAYSHVVALGNESFFSNMMNTALANPYLELTLVGTLTDEQWESLWLDKAYVVNGFYSANFNRFTILAGIMQGAFYDLENPKYMNYGSMGFTIGHEFTHGFDDSGRHYGMDGLINSWWTHKSEENFAKAKRCYEDQYSSLTVSAYGSNDTYMTNGNITSNENIADNGAEYVVFQAYEAWVESHGKEKLLPTPYLDTWQKQYYIAQAQGWCAKFTSSGLAVMSDMFVHSQKESRVNGMYQNSVRFAEIFQCPSGSFMNPENKCKLW
ncbi:neprilysin-1-like [Watersipora subatra]|uniref:neprilysin-1-like n=1 Tax=Watersipora subatra TaxID=2589382 RepID=UPI00355BF02F